MAAVQQRLIEDDEKLKTRYETMKRNGARLRAVGALNDPSTKITSIKQVTMPKEIERKSGTHPDFVLPAEMAGNYADKMGRGIFDKTSVRTGKPAKTPPVTKLKPNQATKQTKVTPDMQKGSRKSESSNQLWPAAEMAGHYVDKMDRGEIYSRDNNMTGGVSAPPAKNLHGTTRPKSSRKTANLTRHPVKDQPAIGEPGDSYPMPSDAPPKKRPWEHVKSGVLVRVNESVKAEFGIVSELVLKRMTENYKRFGYRVVVEQARRAPAWKSDQLFLRLIHETAAARENQSGALYRNLSNAALNRLYQLCRSDYNNLYESRTEFLNTLRTAFKRIMETATINYRKNLNLFIGKGRVITERGVKDVEILAEGTDHQMALRLIRNKLLERFGLDTKIQFIFVDGTKYLIEQIHEWVPTLVHENQWIQQSGVDRPGHKGRLHRALGVPADQSIPRSKINKAAHSKNAHMRHMAQFAKNA